MRLLEELYYHSSYKPKYISELKHTLRDSGIIPEKEPKKVELRLKNSFKETKYWKQGYIFKNKKIKKDRQNIRSIDDIDVSEKYGPVNLLSGYSQEQKLFENKSVEQKDKKTETVTLRDFPNVVLQKAIHKVDFYKYKNLKKYFPGLKTIHRFIESLQSIQVEVSSTPRRLSKIDRDDQLSITIKVLHDLKKQIANTYTEYEGTKHFKQYRVKDELKDKELRINVSNGEAGVPMSKAKKDELTLNLKDKDWYAYDENYGTDQEKFFVKFIDSNIEKLREKFQEIYVIRNPNLIKLYRFSDGKGIEPDFLLYLKEQGAETQYQLFIEPKGEHLKEKDEWKEEFLTSIQNQAQTEILAENAEYKLYGLPLYNKNNEISFAKKLNTVIGTDVQ